jgi:hypothetical protein
MIKIPCQKATSRPRYNVDVARVTWSYVGRLHDVVGKLLCAVEIANRGEKDIEVFGIGLPYPIDRPARFAIHR